MIHHEKKIISDDPFYKRDHQPALPWMEDNHWPAHWIHAPQEGKTGPTTPLVTAFRIRFELPAATTPLIHLSALQRYILFVNGQLLGFGPERSDALHQCFDTYRLSLDAGEHTVSVLVYSYGKAGPAAFMARGNGLVMASQDIPIDTGKAPWQSLTLEGISCNPDAPDEELITGAFLHVNLQKFVWDYARGRDGSHWQPARTGAAACSFTAANHFTSPPYLIPAKLPPMVYEPITGTRVLVVNKLQNPQQADSTTNQGNYQQMFAALLSGKTPVTVAAHSAIWVLVDLGNYHLVYPSITLDKATNASVAISFSESLCFNKQKQHTPRKGNRSEWDKKYWSESKGDTIYTAEGGGGTAYALHFRAGRYMALSITTDSTPLCIRSLELHKTHYPLQFTAKSSVSEPWIESLLGLCKQTLLCCCNETFFDCPYYEQLMYLGDTRLQALMMYVLDADKRLAKKALELFDYSRNASGIPSAAYPCSGSARIAPFSLVWIGMIHDYVWWNRQHQDARAFLPGMRAVIEYWESLRTADGLIASGAGWNFIDASRPSGVDPFAPQTPRWGEVKSEGSTTGVTWHFGTPPGGYAGGVSSVINLWYVYFLRMAAELETYLGEPELAARLHRLRRQSFDAIITRFYCEEQGIIADDEQKQYFSEHALCLALLNKDLCSNALQQSLQKHLFEPVWPLAETTFYFSHYYFETCRLYGRIDKLLERLKRWQIFIDNGMLTTAEEPEPARSDCHAWSAHPLLHFYTTLAGIRPGAAGATHLCIQPQPGPLKEISASMPLGAGSVEVKIRNIDACLHGQIALPPQVSATVILAHDRLEVPPGGTISF